MSSSPSCNRKACLAGATLTVACAVPLAIGMAAMLDPIGRDKPPEWVAVTTLHALPVDSAPQRVPVSMPHFDAWTKLPDQVVGHVFLDRHGDRMVTAFKATYLGAPLEFDPGTNQFWTPCWKGVRFDIAGRRLPPVDQRGDLRQVRLDLDGDSVHVNLADVTNVDR
jgi:hypothetical protein